MFIIHGKRKIDNVTLLLTIDEAKELKDGISQLLYADDLHHVHVSSSDYQTEISVSIVEKNNIESYHSDIRMIINGPSE